MGAMAIPDLARLAAALADPVRAAMVGALFGGVALPQQELARRGGVAPSTASEHLARLVDVGLLVRTTAGRRRYYRLVGPEVAEALERLGTLAPPAPRPRTLSQNDRLRVMTLARTCYDHLAGMLGTQLMESMLDNELLTGGDGVFDPDAPGDDRLASPGFDLDYRLTPSGVRELKAFGIDFDALPSRRPLIKYCVDWSEQRHHLAGSLGAAIATRMTDLGWVRKAPHSRAIHVTST